MKWKISCDSKTTTTMKAGAVVALKSPTSKSLELITPNN